MYSRVVPFFCRLHCTSSSSGVAWQTAIVLSRGAGLRHAHHAGRTCKEVLRADTHARVILIAWHAHPYPPLLTYPTAGASVLWYVIQCLHNIYTVSLQMYDSSNNIRWNKIMPELNKYWLEFSTSVHFHKSIYRYINVYLCIIWCVCIFYNTLYINRHQPLTLVSSVCKSNQTIYHSCWMINFGWIMFITSFINFGWLRNTYAQGDMYLYICVGGLSIRPDSLAEVIYNTKSFSKWHTFLLDFGFLLCMFCFYLCASLP